MLPWCIFRRVFDGVCHPMNLFSPVSPWVKQRECVYALREAVRKRFFFHDVIKRGVEAMQIRFFSLHQMSPKYVVVCLYKRTRVIRK